MKTNSYFNHSASQFSEEELKNLFQTLLDLNQIDAIAAVCELSDTHRSRTSQNSRKIKKFLRAENQKAFTFLNCLN